MRVSGNRFESNERIEFVQFVLALLAGLVTSEFFAITPTKRTNSSKF